MTYGTFMFHVYVSNMKYNNYAAR